MTAAELVPSEARLTDDAQALYPDETAHEEADVPEVDEYETASDEVEEQDEPTLDT